MGRRHKFEIVYSDQDKEVMFDVWLQHNKPGMGELRDLLPEFAGGKPSVDTLYRYRIEGHWVERADLVDEMAIEKNRQSAADQRAEMFKRHADRAKQLEDKAMTYMLENEFKDMGTALKALQFAMDEQRKAMGVGAAAVNVFALTNEQVGNKLAELLNRAGAEDAMVIDGTAEDVPDGIQN